MTPIRCLVPSLRPIKLAPYNLQLVLIISNGVRLELVEMGVFYRCCYAIFRECCIYEYPFEYPVKN